MAEPKPSPQIASLNMTSSLGTSSIMMRASVAGQKKIVCQRLVDFSLFSICYVQPMPLPSEVAMLQRLNTKGMTFVKIPVAEKDVRLYLKDQIHQLLKLSNINGSYIDKLIDDYNRDATDMHRDRLLRVVNVARDYCDVNNIEFLTDRVESVEQVPAPTGTS